MPRAAGVLEALDHGHARQVQVSRQRDARGAVDAVAGLHPAQHQVGRLALDGGGQHTRHRERVDVLERVVPDALGAVGALGQARAQALLGLLGADRDDHHLASALGLRELESGLE